MIINIYLPGRVPFLMLVSYPTRGAISNGSALHAPTNNRTEETTLTLLTR